MPRIIAAVQAALGLTGIVVCVVLYLQYAGPLGNALLQLEQLASDAEAELKISRQLVLDADSVVEDLELAARAHSETLDTTDGLVRGFSDNLQQWSEQLESFSKLAIDAGNVCDNFGEQLPLKIPNVAYDLQSIELEIPSIELREQVIKLPYPTAKLGSRVQQLDVGITKLALDVPTLEIGSADRAIRVPDSPKVSTQKRSIQVPDNFRVIEKEIFNSEKALLSNVASELERSASSLHDSSVEIGRVRSLIKGDFSTSLKLTGDNLELMQTHLRRMRAEHIPQALQRIDNQTDEVAIAKASFSRLEPLVAWGFVLVGMIPAGIFVHGCFLLSYARRRD